LLLFLYVYILLDIYKLYFVELLLLALSKIDISFLQIFINLIKVQHKPKHECIIHEIKIFQSLNLFFLLVSNLIICIINLFISFEILDRSLLQTQTHILLYTYIRKRKNVLCTCTCAP